MTSNILSSLVQLREPLENRLRTAKSCNLCATSAQLQREHVSGARVAQEWLKYTIAFCLVFTLGVGNAWGTTIASWGCASYSASTNYPSTGGDANNYSSKNDKAYFSSTKAFTASGGDYAYYGSSSGGAVITFNNLNLSAYSGIKISFYTRASQQGNMKIQYYNPSTSAWADVDNPGPSISKTVAQKTSTNTIPNTATGIKLTHSQSSGSLYFGTIRIYAPDITCATSSLSGFSYTAGAGPSSYQTFTVSGSDLTSNITISASSDYEVSTASGSGYASSKTLTQSSGSVSSTTIYVRLKSGLSAGTHNGTITMSSTSASNKTITLSGSVASAASCDAPTGPGNSSFFVYHIQNDYCRFF